MPKKKSKNSKSSAKRVANLEKILEVEIEEYLDREGQIVQIAETLDNYPSLPPRERDFARRYATEFWRSAQGWAKLYGVSRGTINRMLKNPSVIAAVGEIKSDFTKYTMAKQMLLMQLSADKYIEILRLEVTDDNVETIRKTCQDIFKYVYGYGSIDAPRPTLNVDMRSQGNPMRPGENEDDGKTVDLDELERRMKIMKQVAHQVKNVKGDGGE